MSEAVSISQETIDVLKNFSTINDGIVIRPGVESDNSIQTISVNKTLIAKAKIKETFPQEFAIYDLNEFLNTMSLFKEPVLIFEGDKYVTVKESKGKSSCKYFFSNADIIKSINKDIKMPDTEINFVLSGDNMGKMLKAAAVLGVGDVAVENKDKSIIMKVHNSKDDTSNAFDLAVGEYTDSANFSIHFKTENFLLMDDGYEVGISSKKISHFKSSTKNVEYWIAIEASSTYEG